MTDPARPAAVPEPNSQANNYDLTGSGIRVSYASVTFVGNGPQLHYEDQHQTHDFAGETIRTIDSALGRLLEVTIDGTAGADKAATTTFTLLIPRVQLQNDPSAQVECLGITSSHRSAADGTAAVGQLDTYGQVVRLTGTASLVST